MTNPALSALARKRAELGGEIMALGRRIERLRADLAHLDAALLIMDPDAIRPKRPSGKGSGWFGHGEPQRLALDAIRTAEAPAGCREIARAVMRRRGLDAGDGKALRRARALAQMIRQRTIKNSFLDRIPDGGANKRASSVDALGAAGFAHGKLEACSPGASLPVIVHRSAGSSHVPLPVVAPVAALGVPQRVPGAPLELDAVALPPHVLAPRHLARVELQARAGDVVVLAELGPPQPREAALGLVGAGVLVGEGNFDSNRDGRIDAVVGGVPFGNQHVILKNHVSLDVGQF